jgi:glucosylceramidase
VVIGDHEHARFSYSYDDTCCDLNDFTLARDVDVMALTKQAKALNPATKVMASPWTAPAWMKDNNSFVQGWLQAQYYPLYAQYFARYIQGYAAQG